MEQLVDRVHAALAAEYPGAPNGRVRDLPDRRSIRWYSTIGLVDRPVGTHGRAALYGPRHLLQLVAIKRRQAAGRTLADIQVELAGASDEELTAVAGIPAGLLTDTDGPAPDDAARPDFWRQPPAAAPATAQADLQRPSSIVTYDPETAHRHGPADPPLLTGLPLGGGVILLVPQPLSGLHRDEITAAARPLLDLLASRGLTNGRSE